LQDCKFGVNFFFNRDEITLYDDDLRVNEDSFTNLRYVRRFVLNNLYGTMGTESAVMAYVSFLLLLNPFPTICTFHNPYSPMISIYLQSEAQLPRNFMIMAIAFSVNHATVTAMIALASSSLGKDLGNLQTALLYLFYTLTALFASKSIVSYTGGKYGIVSGLGLYVFYVASFIIADTCPSLRTPAAVIGGSIGGIAAGFLWTAQFVYFGANVELYAEVAKDRLLSESGRNSEDMSDVEVKEFCVKKVSANFAAYFAVPYLSLEVVFKLMQSFIGNDSGPVSAHWSAGKHFIYVINTVFAVGAAAACFLIMDLKPSKGEAH